MTEGSTSSTVARRQLGRYLRELRGKSRFTVKWLTSSRSNGRAACVEVAFLGEGRVGLRDSKDHGTGPAHVCTRTEWEAFLAGAEDGVFDLCHTEERHRRRCGQRRSVEDLVERGHEDRHPPVRATSTSKRPAREDSGLFCC